MSVVDTVPETSSSASSLSSTTSSSSSNSSSIASKEKGCMVRSPSVVRFDGIDWEVEDEKSRRGSEIRSKAKQKRLQKKQWRNLMKEHHKQLAITSSERIIQKIFLIQIVLLIFFHGSKYFFRSTNHAAVTHPPNHMTTNHSMTMTSVIDFDMTTSSTRYVPDTTLILVTFLRHFVFILSSVSILIFMLVPSKLIIKYLSKGITTPTTTVNKNTKILHKLKTN